jgi:8-hydroxy-5-deazaflavin:NADPH oxidoreductase
MASITIIGTGDMALGLGMRAIAGGNQVQILSRNLSKATALAAELRPTVPGTLGDPLTGDLVILAVPHDAAETVVADYGDALDGKVIVDITNPIDNATMTGLAVPEGSSGAEEIAKAAPAGARVVKAFNTTFSATLAPGDQQLDVFLAGDDPDAKATLASVIQSMGMRPLDVGPLSMARWLEGLGLIAITLAIQGENFESAVKIIG